MAILTDIYWSVLKLFQLFGYHCSLVKSDQIVQCWLICFLVNVATGILLMSFIYYFQNSILFTDDGLGYAIDFTKFVANFVIYFSFLAESYYFRHDFAKLWNKFQIVENYVSIWVTTCTQNGREVLISYWKVISTFFAYLVFWDVFYALVICPEIRSTYFTLVFLIIFALTHLRQFLIVFYTNLIAHYLKLVEDHSWFILSQSNALALLNSPINDFHLIQVELLSVTNVCERISDIMQSFNCILGFSLFIIKIREHAHILTDSYWIIFRIIDGDIFRSICKYAES